MQSAGRNSSVITTLKLVSALLDGEAVDRYRGKEVAGVEEAAAWAQLVQIRDHLKGAREITVARKRSKHIVLDLAALLGEMPRATLVAACLGMSMGRLFEDASYSSATKTAFKRLLAGAESAELFEDHERKFTFVPRGGEVAVVERPDVVGTIIAALLEGHRLRLDVQHVHEQPNRHTVEPLTLAVHHHQLYLIAWKLSGRGESARRDLHPFRVARVVRAAKQQARFKYPALHAYDPAALFQEVFGIYLGFKEPATNVDVRLTGRWARYARSHRWHPSQRPLKRGKDWIVIRLFVRPCPEVEAWILSLGSEAEVLGPPELRARVEAQVEAMAATVAARRTAAG